MNRNIPPLMRHQADDVRFYQSSPLVFNTSDPGTGKTRTVLEFLARTPATQRGRVLVLCPKSICQAAWGNDIEKFTPELSYAVATAENRKDPFADSSLDLVITNHDAVKAIGGYNLSKFNALVVDESTAYKSPTSQRSKAIAKLSEPMEYRTCLTGTPIPNGILDLWHQLFILDRGKRLGSNFYRFRSLTCDPRPIPGVFGNTWTPKPGIESVIGALFQDITIRRALEDCVDLPSQIVRRVNYKPSPALKKAYDQLRRDSLLLFETGNIVAVNAGVLLSKLLQLASGTAYGENGPVVLDSVRYELVADLADMRTHSLVAFNWRHQRDQLIKEFAKRKMSCALIDGSVSQGKRTELVNRFQAGDFRVLLCHPQSTGHGLTLTKGTGIIWASPTYNLEHYLQFNRRIYRYGQDQKTEVIQVAAEGTLDTAVYSCLDGKKECLTNILEMLS